MPVYIRCPECKSDQKIQNKKCCKCSQPMPKQGKRYKVVIKHHGKIVTKQTHSLELARQIEVKIKSELIEGSYYDRKKKVPTLEKVWERYAERSQSTVKGFSKDANRYDTQLKNRFANKTLDLISPFDLEKMVMEMKKTTTIRGGTYSPKTIHNAVELLNRLFNYAHRMRIYKGENPCKQIVLPKVNNEITNELDENKLGDLLNTLDEWPDRMVANLVKLAVMSGLRRGELFNLKWKYVDLNKGWLTIRNPKGGKDQVIPLCQSAVEILKDHPKTEKSDYVFPSTRGGRRSDIKKPWLKIKGKAQLPDAFRFHDLRHTFASLLASSGKVDLYTLQKLLTHQSPQMTQRYTHLVESALRRSVHVMDEIYNRAKQTINFEETGKAEGRNIAETKN